MSYTENINPTDPYLEISKGNVLGSSPVNKFGENHNIDIATAPEDIWSPGGIYVPPTANRTHQVKSDDPADAGTLIGTYTSTTFSQTSLIDSGATFITNGVSIGDTIVNDTNQDHSIVLAVVSETELTVESWHHTDESNVGNTFRIGSPASTGAVFIHVRLGYQKDGTSITEFILMNGITNVPTVNDYYRITRVHVHGVGGNGSNVGNITLTADIDTTVTAYIETGHGQTLMAFTWVPQGKTGYMTSYSITMYRGAKIANAMAQMQLMSNLWGGDAEQIDHSSSVGATGGMVRIVFNPPKKYTQGTDVWIRCKEVTDDGSEISASFDMVLVDNK